MEFKNKTELIAHTQMILKEKQLVPTFCAVYGSHVYGTATELSDYDIYVIAVPDPDAEKKNNEAIQVSYDLHQEKNEKDMSVIGTTSDKPIDLTVRSFDEFKASVRKGDPQAIELLLTPEQFVLMGSEQFTEFKNTVDMKAKQVRQTIRSGFSEKASWAESRARKKFKDGEIKIALKSQFHSYRILFFGIQIGLTGQIYDWGIANDYLRALFSVPEIDLNDQYFRDSTKEWTKTKLLTKKDHGIDGTVATCFKIALPKIV